jgi:hypothetical protein
MNHDEVIQAVAEWFRADAKVTLVTKTYGRGFPNPDVSVQYTPDKVAYVECKPSDAGGREYLTGLGQCVAYLLFSDFSYLALPEKEMHEYQKYFWVKDVGLLAVKDNFSVNRVRQALESSVVTAKERRERGYGYYRDLKPLEIHALLKAIQSKRISQQKLDVKKIEDAMWQQVCKMRNIQSQTQKSAWVLNMRLLLRDLQLINPQDYSLTEHGFRLLQLGDLSDKQPYMNELARSFLINANFLDIVTLIQTLNDKYSGFSSVSEFKELLVKEIYDEKLATKGTNVMRDLQDIPRILKDLNIISDWMRMGLVNRYIINWKYILSVT